MTLWRLATNIEYRTLSAHFGIGQSTVVVDVPLVILDDPSYPLLPWLMKLYPETAHSTTEEKRYNYRQSRARMPVENAFGCLKGCWRCLLKHLDYNIANVPNVVAACVLLHNMCEMFGDHCSDEWVYHEAPTATQASSIATSVRGASASVIRDAIKNFISS